MCCLSNFSISDVRMKLIVATPLYPPEIGGPATYAKLLFEGLPAKGIEVETVKFSEVRHLPKVIRHIAYYRRVLRAARRADAVLALDPVSVGLPAIAAARHAGKPFVVKIVGDYAWEQGQQRFGITENLDSFVAKRAVPFPVRILRFVQTRVALGATRIIVPSYYLKGIIAAWGIPTSSIEVLYNAVPLGAIGAVPEAVRGLPRPLVVTAGRIVPWKHMEGVIDAVAGIPGASAVIIGDGPGRGELERYAGEKLANRAVFTGLLSHADTLAVVQSADVFVLNSSYEGLSHQLIEAQMLGVPTIATRVGGNPEVITDQKSGLLVPSGDTSILIEALTTVLTDATLRAHLSRGAVLSAERFSIESLLTGVATTLRSL